VTVVIDSGRSKEKLYDPHDKLSSLKEDWISQVIIFFNFGDTLRALQIKDADVLEERELVCHRRSLFSYLLGVCFRLYSSRRYGALSSHQDSELVRSSLEELVLTSKTMGLAPGHGHETNGMYSFLSKAMDPPHPLTITNALSSLMMLKCLDQQETITSLGRAVSQLPMDPFLSRALILSALFGVLPSMIRLACAISYR
jgi:HrpA-like RNA helicase